MDDREWFEITKSRVLEWCKERGITETKYADSNKAGWSLSVKPGTVGYRYTPVFNELVISVRCHPNSFTKKIFRKTDKTDAVLQKMSELFETAVRARAVRNAEEQARDNARRLQKRMLMTHIPPANNMRATATGSDEESLKFNLNFEGLTLERALRIIEAAKILVSSSTVQTPGPMSDEIVNEQAASTA